MRKHNTKISLLLSLYFLSSPIMAQEVPLLLPKPTPATTSQNTTTTVKPSNTTSSQPVSISTDFSSCYRTYTLSAENLFLLTLSALSANNYKIKEIQSKSGYIIFTAEKKEFLVGITKINNQVSAIKITPTNNNYTFSQAIVDKIFKYISVNLK